MKKYHIATLILIIAIFAETVFVAYRFGKIVTEENIYHRQTVYYYVPGLTKKIYELNEYKNQQSHQYRWIMERLEGCIRTIETQYGFETIKVEPEEREFGMFPSLGSANYVHFEKTVDLYKPYHIYESSSFVLYDDEKEIVFLYATTNMLALNYQMAEKQRFDEYEKRLKRIEDFKKQ